MAKKQEEPNGAEDNPEQQNPQNQEPQAQDPEGVQDPFDGSAENNPVGSTENNPVGSAENNPVGSAENNPVGSELANAAQGEVPAEKAPIETAYAALAMGEEERRDLVAGIREAAGTEGINVWDLERVTLPAGGMTVWEIPGGGENDHPKSIDGIIVNSTAPRAYWEKSLDDSGGSTPPDCSSEDGVTGHGDPGGDCFECPFNEWGSAETGEGKACKEKRMLFVLREGSYLPIVVQAPSTSIPAMKSHFMRAVSEYGVPYYFVETQLSLEKVTGATFPYSRIVPTIKGKVSRDEKKVLEEYIKAISPAFKAPQAVSVQQDE